MKTIILIPARYDSSRFPGKLLEKVNGKVILDYVHRNVTESGFDYAFVAGDQKIFDYCQLQKFNVVKVFDKTDSGSDRIAIALERYFSTQDYTHIINVQADEPLLTGEEIRKIGDFHNSNSHFDIVTIVKKRSTQSKDFKNPNTVKCIFSPNSKKCLYFSRNNIPYSREELSDFPWYQHIGVYSFKVKKLLEFSKLENSHYESLEKLEQLKALEFGFSFGAVETEKKLIGIDTEEDIIKVEELLRGN